MVARETLPSISSSLTSQKLRTALKAHDILVKLVEPGSVDAYMCLLDELGVAFRELEELVEAGYGESAKTIHS